MGKKNFAIIGCAGYIAPKHLKAIRDTGNLVVAALDKSDSVGIMDSYFDDVHFFTEFERFDRHVEKLRRQSDKKVHYVSICTPNYLHDAHIRFALRIGADAICEKPLVLNPWNLDALEKLEEETGRRVFCVLQLRHHPDLIELKKAVDREYRGEKYDIDMSYITPRGKWYDVSWKGDVSMSGGLATNLGIHFFDMLMWIFGRVVDFEVHHSSDKRMSGYLELEKAKVKWYLSTDKGDVPDGFVSNGEYSAYRSILVNGKEVEFSNVFGDLHTEVYKGVYNGEGFGLRDVRPSIELASKLRMMSPVIIDDDKVHRLLKISSGINPEVKNYYVHPSSENGNGAEIGKGTKIWHNSHIMPGSRIGENCVLGQNVYVGKNVKIGKGCKIQNNVSVYEGVELEDDVFCGPSMVFTNVLNPRANVERKNEFTKILIKKGSTLGANSTIVGNVTIGKNAFIGAGAIVTKNVRDYALVLGVPAVQKGWVCECGEILSREISSEFEKILDCLRCGKKYKHQLDNFSPLTPLPQTKNFFS
jgi:UDP-N-acetyl-2-amino-2-deoxyglucuronate dehydrogenase